jgi:hypothetical protein
MGVCKRTVIIPVEFDIILQVSGYYDQELVSFEIEDIDLVEGNILDLIVYFSNNDEDMFLKLEKLVLNKIL